MVTNRVPEQMQDAFYLNITVTGLTIIIIIIVIIRLTIFIKMISHVRISIAKIAKLNSVRCKFSALVG